MKSEPGGGPLDKDSMVTESANRMAALFYGALIVMLVFVGTHVLGIGGDDRVLIQTFSSDENRAMLQLQVNLEHGDLDPRGYYNYGYLYHTACYYPLRLLAALGFDAAAPRTIVFVTRAVSLVAFVGLITGFLHALRSIRLELGYRLAFAALLAANAIVYRWGYRTHPDLLLALLGVLILIVLLPRVSTRRLLVASGLAGLAMGTKASGVYYVILIAATFIAERLRHDPDDWREELHAWLRIGTPAIGVFLAAWLLSNPYVIPNWGDFIGDFMHEQKHVARGHGQEVDTSVLDWMSALVRTFGGWGFACVAVGWLGVLGLARSAYRAPESTDSLPHPSVLIGALAFALISAAHLFLVVDLRATRYLLPLLPTLTWLSAFGWSLLLARWPRVPLAAISLLLAVPVATNAWKGARLTRTFADRYEHPRVVAGHWLADHYPRSTRVLLERYSYAPVTRFDDIQIVTRMSPQALDKHPADLIVINRKKSGRWSWRRDGSRFEARDFVVSDMDKADEVQEFHMELFAPDSPWHVVYETDDVVILERRDSARHPRPRSRGPTGSTRRGMND